MIINGENYNFYEVQYPQYALFLAKNLREAYMEYKFEVFNGEDLDIEFLEIEKVDYEYAKRKYELNPELANRAWLSVDGEITYEKFNSIVQFVVEDDKSGDDKILLYQEYCNYDELGEEIEQL